MNIEIIKICKIQALNVTFGLLFDLITDVTHLKVRV